MGFQTAKHQKTKWILKDDCNLQPKIPGHFFEYHSLSHKNIFRNEASKYIHFKSSKHHCFALDVLQLRYHTHINGKNPPTSGHTRKTLQGIHLRKRPRSFVDWWYFLFFSTRQPSKNNNKTPLNLGKRHNQKKQGSLQKEIVGPHWRCFLPHQQRWVSFKPSVFACLCVVC